MNACHRASAVADVNPQHTGRHCVNAHLHRICLHGTRIQRILTMCAESARRITQLEAASTHAEMPPAKHLQVDDTHVSSQNHIQTPV